MSHLFKFFVSIGSEHSFTYANDLLHSITDTVGRVLTFTYADDKLVSISDGVRTTTYSYLGDKLAVVTNLIKDAGDLFCVLSHELTHAFLGKEFSEIEIGKMIVAFYYKYFVDPQFTTHDPERHDSS